MNWAHIVVTAICTLDNSAIAVEKQYPCIFIKTGLIGPHCLDADGENNKCACLSWCQTDNTVVMTDESGLDYEHADYAADEKEQLAAIIFEFKPEEDKLS